MREYIKESHSKIQDRREYLLYHIPVLVVNKFPKHIDINQIINLVKEKVSSKVFNGLDAIYIGDFKELNKRDIQAMFKDGAIWLSSNNINSYITEETVATNILHEVAHLLEDKYHNFIYSDNKVEKEYDSKKLKLMNIIKSEGYSVFEELFFSEEYLNELDKLLYKEIGYDKLALLSLGLFVTPYSVTTLREYFADGFQMFFSEERDYLRDISPILYNKIKNLISEVENEI